MHDCRKVHWVDVRWLRPPMGWVCLNTDGSAHLGRRVAGCGGLIRDYGGRWICGFSRNLGDYNAFIAELWGAMEGLQLAVQRGFNCVEFQVDSQVVAGIIQGRNSASAAGWGLIQRLKMLLLAFKEIKVRHIFREANMCADILAGLGCNSHFGMIVYEQAPVQLDQALHSDVIGVFTLRRSVV